MTARELATVWWAIVALGVVILAGRAFVLALAYQIEWNDEAQARAMRAAWARKGKGKP